MQWGYNTILPGQNLIKVWEEKIIRKTVGVPVVTPKPSQGYNGKVIGLPWAALFL